MHVYVRYKRRQQQQKSVGVEKKRASQPKPESYYAVNIAAVDGWRDSDPYSLFLVADHRRRPPTTEQQHARLWYHGICPAALAARISDLWREHRRGQDGHVDHLVRCPTSSSSPGTRLVPEAGVDRPA